MYVVVTSKGRGELGTRGLRRLLPRRRSRLLAGAGVEVDPAEEEELDTLRAWRAEVGGAPELSTEIRDDFTVPGEGLW